MKLAGSALVALAAIATFATPALAGKKKSKKKAKVVQKEESRRLCDELGLGIVLAEKSANAPAPVEANEGKALAAAEAFDLSRLTERRSDAPSGEAAIRMEAQTLAQSDVADVVKGHGSDIEYCWNRVPAAKREASSFTLRLTVDARGVVSSASLGGDAPAALSKCLVPAVKRWQFPIADTTSEVEYPLSFK